MYILLIQRTIWMTSDTKVQTNVTQKFRQYPL